MRVITLIGCAVTGYLFGGIWGTAGLVLLWAGVLLANKNFRASGTLDLPQTDGPDGEQVDANIDAMVDSLEEVARERRWSLDKRLQIARMACENPSVSIDKAEDFYDRGFRAVPKDTGQSGKTQRENCGPGWRVLP